MNNNKYAADIEKTERPGIYRPLIRQDGPTGIV
jgi:hypothetical protein